MRSQQISYRPDVDGLRAVAIGLVLVYHLWPEFLTGGFVGVDVFFVISGYLITKLLTVRMSQGDHFVWAFYRARIYRLFPALITVCLASVVLGICFLVPSDLARLGKHLFSTLGFIENWTLRHESGYFDAEVKTKPLAHMWSLSIEEQFYLIYPWLLILANRLGFPSKRILVIFFGLSFTASVFWVFRDPASTYLMPWMRAWEFLLGGRLAFQHTKRAPFPPLAPCLMRTIGLSLILLSGVLLNGNQPFPGALALPAVLGAGLVILAGTEDNGQSSLLGHSVLIRLGLISYPLYLWHWVLLAFLHLWRGTLVTDLEIACCGLLAIGLAFLTYHGVERPIQSGPKSKLRTQSLLGLGLTIAALGLFLSKTQGLPQRYPPLPEGLIPKDGRFPSEWRFGRCLLVSNQHPKDFGDECFSFKGSQEPSSQVLLWGDSYAGHLYPGLKEKLEREGLSLIQLTAVGCPPLLGYTTPRYPNCAEVGEYVVEYLEKHPTTPVILAANWVGVLRDERYQLLDATIARLQRAQVRNITVFGPPPLWVKPLPTLIMEAKKAHPEEEVPERFGPERTAPSAREMSDWLRTYAEEHGLGYVSVLDQLCSDSRCLVHQNHVVTSMDHGHLTLSGSRAVFQQIGRLFEGAKPTADERSDPR